MSIADRIAAEHEWAPFWCKCGEPVHDFAHQTTREVRDLHTRHIAEVTEAAVRAQVATERAARLERELAEVQAALAHRTDKENR